MLLITVFAVACSFHEEYDACPMYVRFLYDYNMAGEDLFAKECGRVDLFVFDQNGRLVQRTVDEGSHLAETGYRIPLSVGSGTYTVMAWGGTLASMSYLSDPVENLSVIDDLILRFNDLESAAELEPLWNGTPVTFTVEQTYGHEETVRLIKNTNQINLTLYGAQNTALPATDDIEVKLTAANGTYRYDNDFVDMDNMITYRPFAFSETSNAGLGYSFSTLRLVRGQSVGLAVIDRTTGRSLLSSAFSNIDVINYLLETKPANMEAQEYLDRQDTWNIELYLQGANSGSGETYTAVLIKINGWTVWAPQSGQL